MIVSVGEVAVVAEALILAQVKSQGKLHTLVAYATGLDVDCVVTGGGRGGNAQGLIIGVSQVVAPVEGEEAVKPARGDTELVRVSTLRIELTDGEVGLGLVLLTVLIREVDRSRQTALEWRGDRAVCEAHLEVIEHRTDPLVGLLIEHLGNDAGETHGGVEERLLGRIGEL